MEWQPIETYDALEMKPKFVVFFMEKSDSTGFKLPAEIVTNRVFGRRKITHWIQLPDAPK